MEQGRVLFRLGNRGPIGGKSKGDDISCASHLDSCLPYHASSRRCSFSSSRAIGAPLHQFFHQTSNYVLLRPKPGFLTGGWRHRHLGRGRRPRLPWFPKSDMELILVIRSPTLQGLLCGPTRGHGAVGHDSGGGRPGKAETATDVRQGYLSSPPARSDRTRRSSIQLAGSSWYPQ